MASSLERLAHTLPADKFNYTFQAFKREKLVLMKKKGVYPYDYMDSFQKLATNNYPQKRNFIVIVQMRALVMSNTNMLKYCGIYSG